MNVCDALLKVLGDYGVNYIFGIPGDAINELLESIRKQDRIEFIHVMHEEAGAFAASAQAKLSGKLAVCVGTAGPGALHLLNGLYDAKLDHAPVLAITGQVETSLFGTGHMQEVNLLSVFEDVTVFNQAVIDESQMPELAILACQTALSKPGVAHLNLHSNISRRTVKGFEEKRQRIFNNVHIVPYRNDLRTAADYINRSEKPLVLAGIGAKKAVNELLAFARHINAPIIKALRGKDLIPDIHPFSIGGIGYLGIPPAVKAMNECDLLIITGSDFPYNEFYPPENIPTIQIDIDVNHIGRRHPVTVPLGGDVKLTLTELMPLVHLKEKMIF